MVSDGKYSMALNTLNHCVVGCGGILLLSFYRTSQFYNTSGFIFKLCDSV